MSYTIKSHLVASTDQMNPIDIAPGARFGTLNLKLHVPYDMFGIVFLGVHSLNRVPRTNVRRIESAQTCICGLGFDLGFQVDGEGHQLERIYQTAREGNLLSTDNPSVEALMRKANAVKPVTAWLPNTKYRLDVSLTQDMGFELDDEVSAPETVSRLALVTRGSFVKFDSLLDNEGNFPGVGMHCIQATVAFADAVEAVAAEQALSRRFGACSQRLWRDHVDRAAMQMAAA